MEDVLIMHGMVVVVVVVLWCCGGGVVVVPDAVQGGLHLSELPAPLRLDGHVLVLAAPAGGEVLAQGGHAIWRRLQHLGLLPIIGES